MTDDRDPAEPGGGFWEAVSRDSEARLADPLTFALEALDDLFGHGRDEEHGFERFESKLEEFFWWADDAVQCFERVEADPPPHVGRLIRERTSVVVWVSDAEGDTVGDEAAHEGWFHATTTRLRAMFDSYVAGRTSGSDTRPGN